MAKLGRPPVADKDRRVTVNAGLPQRDVEKLDALAKRLRLTRGQMAALILGQRLDEEAE